MFLVIPSKEKVLVRRWLLLDNGDDSVKQSLNVELVVNEQTSLRYFYTASKRMISSFFFLHIR